MKMTIRKIAELAGVSRGTVDKVIHNRPGVKASVRQHVLEVIEETGYVPIHQPRELPRGLITKTVAVIIPKFSNPFFLALKQGMDQMCSMMQGIHLEYYYCDTTDINGFLNVLDSLNDHQIDLYLIRGVRSARIKERLSRLDKAIIFIDSIVPGADYLCFVGEDCYKSGRIIASLLAKTVPQKGEIVVICGSPQVVGHKLRLEGFMDAMRVYCPNIKIVGQIYSQDQSAIAYDKTFMALQQYPNLCGICNLAGHAGEVGQAILDCNRQGSVKLICYNATEDIAALMKKGVIEFSISIAPYQQGQLVMEIIQQYLINKKEPARKFFRTPVSIVIDENMDVYLDMETEYHQFPKLIQE